MLSKNTPLALLLTLLSVPQFSYAKQVTVPVHAFLKSFITESSPPSTFTIQAKQNNKVIKTWDIRLPITYDPKRANRKCSSIDLTYDDEMPLEFTYSGNIADLKIEPTLFNENPIQDLKTVEQIQLSTFVFAKKKDAFHTETYLVKNSPELKK